MTRDRLMFFRISDFERDLLEKQAAAAHINIPEYLRWLIRSVAGAVPAVADRDRSPARTDDRC